MTNAMTGSNPVANAWMKAVLRANGVDKPEMIRRVILDVAYDNVALLYYERIADAKTFEIQPKGVGFEVVTNEAKSND